MPKFEVKFNTMPLQYITDTNGKHTAVLISIDEWEKITNQHADLKQLEKPFSNPAIKLSDLAGKLPAQTADAMHKYVEESRNEWEQRIQKQL